MRRGLGLVLLAVMWAGAALAQNAPAKDDPAALGFQHFYKCPSDLDAVRLGDTVTAKRCLDLCQSLDNVSGCWWLDGTGGFPRQCRVCRTQLPVPRSFPNDWALPLRSTPRLNASLPLER